LRIIFYIGIDFFFDIDVLCIELIILCFFRVGEILVSGFFFGLWFGHKKGDLQSKYANDSSMSVAENQKERFYFHYYEFLPRFSILSIDSSKSGAVVKPLHLRAIK